MDRGNTDETRLARHVHGDGRKPETGIEPSADNAIKASSAYIEIKLTNRKKIYSHGG